MAAGMTISIFKDNRHGGYIAELIYLDERTGEKKSVRRHGKGRKEAAGKIDLIRQQIDESGFLPDKAKITLGGWLNRWLETYQKNIIKIRTYQQQQMYVDKYIIPALGSKPLTQLKGADIQQFFNTMLVSGRLAAQKRIKRMEAEQKQAAAKKTRRKFGEKEKPKPKPALPEGMTPGLSTHTIRIFYSLLNKALKQAKKDGLIRVNPIEATTKPKVKSRPIKLLSEAEANRFLDAAAKHRLYAAFLLSFGTGMRRGEILALKWKNINLKTGSISIKESLNWLDGTGIVFDTPKTEASIRTVEIPKDILDELKAHRSRQAQEKLDARAKAKKHAEKFGCKVDFAAYYQDTGMVFCTPEGRPIDPHNWARLKKKIAEEAKVPDFRIHDMRHFFCTQLIKRGVNVKAVQGMLGHSTAAMTLNVYSHVDQEMLKDAAATMVGVLTKRKKAAGEK